MGRRGKNHSHYSGLLGVIERNEADFTGVGVRMKSDVMQFSKFLFPELRPTWSFVFRQPPLTYVDNLYSLSFDRSLWMSSGLLVLVVCIFLYASAIAEWILTSSTSGQEARASRMNVVEVLMVSVSAVCQQGTAFEPRTFSGRIVLFVTFLALFFLYTAYSANIIVLLQSSSTKINTLVDLAESRLKLGVENTSYNLNYLQSTSDKILKKIWQKKINPFFEKAHIYEASIGIQMVQQQQFAFGMPLEMAYRSIQKTFLESEKCGLNEITYIDSTDLYFAAAKNTTYSELVKTVFHRMQERGILVRSRLRAFGGKPKCESVGSNFVTVTLGDAYAAFYIFLFGVLTAFGFLLVEILQTKFLKNIDLVGSFKQFVLKKSD